MESKAARFTEAPNKAHLPEGAISDEVLRGASDAELAYLMAAPNTSLRDKFRALIVLFPNVYSAVEPCQVVDGKHNVTLWPEGSNDTSNEPLRCGNSTFYTCGVCSGNDNNLWIETGDKKQVFTSRDGTVRMEDCTYIYSISCERCGLVYVGQATSLGDRWRAHRRNCVTDAPTQLVHDHFKLADDSGCVPTFRCLFSMTDNISVTSRDKSKKCTILSLIENLLIVHLRTLYPLGPNNEGTVCNRQFYARDLFPRYCIGYSLYKRVSITDCKVRQLKWQVQDFDCCDRRSNFPSLYAVEAGKERSRERVDKSAWEDVHLEKALRNVVSEPSLKPIGLERVDRRMKDCRCVWQYVQLLMFMMTRYVAARLLRTANSSMADCRGAYWLLVEKIFQRCCRRAHIMKIDTFRAKDITVTIPYVDVAVGAFPILDILRRHCSHISLPSRSFPSVPTFDVRCCYTAPLKPALCLHRLPLPCSPLPSLLSPSHTSCVCRLFPRCSFPSLYDMPEVSHMHFSNGKSLRVVLERLEFDADVIDLWVEIVDDFGLIHRFAEPLDNPAKDVIETIMTALKSNSKLAEQGIFLELVRGDLIEEARKYFGGVVHPIADREQRERAATFGRLCESVSRLHKHIKVGVVDKVSHNLSFECVRHTELCLMHEMGLGLYRPLCKDGSYASQYSKASRAEYGHPFTGAHERITGANESGSPSKRIKLGVASPTVQVRAASDGSIIDDIFGGVGGGSSSSASHLPSVKDDPMNGLFDDDMSVCSLGNGRSTFGAGGGSSSSGGALRSHGNVTTSPRPIAFTSRARAAQPRSDQICTSSTFGAGGGKRSSVSCFGLSTSHSGAGSSTDFLRPDATGNNHDLDPVPRSRGANKGINSRACLESRGLLDSDNDFCQLGESSSASSSSSSSCASSSDDDGAVLASKRSPKPKAKAKAKFLHRQVPNSTFTRGSGTRVPVMSSVPHLARPRMPVKGPFANSERYSGCFSKKLAKQSFCLEFLDKDFEKLADDNQATNADPGVEATRANVEGKVSSSEVPISSVFGWAECERLTHDTIECGDFLVLKCNEKTATRLPGDVEQVPCAYRFCDVSSDALKGEIADSFGAMGIDIDQKLPFANLYHAHKAHKPNYAVRPVTNTGRTFIDKPSTILRKILDVVFHEHKSLRHNIYGVWVVRSVTEAIEKFKNKSVGELYSYDFPSCYTALQHEEIVHNVMYFVRKAFGKASSRERIYVHKSSYACTWAKPPDSRQANYIAFGVDDVKRLLIELLSNAYIEFGRDGTIFRQICGIPMGLSCSSIICDLCLMYYEELFLLQAHRDGRSHVDFCLTSRYQDDCLTNVDLLDPPGKVYPVRYGVSRQNISKFTTTFLQAMAVSHENFPVFTIFDKRREFNFRIINFPSAKSMHMLCKEVPNLTIGQLVSYLRVCSEAAGFYRNAINLFQKMRVRNYDHTHISKGITCFVNRHYRGKYYGWGRNEMLEGLLNALKALSSVSRFS